MRAIFSRPMMFSCILSLLVLCPSTSAFASLSLSQSMHSGSSHSAQMSGHPQGSPAVRFQLTKPQSHAPVKPNESQSIGGASGCVVQVYAGIYTGNELWGQSETTCNGDTIEITVKNYWMFCSNYAAICFNWVIKANGTFCSRATLSSLKCPASPDYYDASPASFWGYESNVCVTFLDGTNACGSPIATVWTN